MKRTKYVRDLWLNIECLYLGQQYVKSRGDTRCGNLCSCMYNGGSWVDHLEGVNSRGKEGG